jgi:hypothetical protein
MPKVISHTWSKLCWFRQHHPDNPMERAPEGVSPRSGHVQVPMWRFKGIRGGWHACPHSFFHWYLLPSLPILNVEVSVCKSQTTFAQRLVESEGEMAQGRQRQPFEIPFTFSLNNVLSIVACNLSKKYFWRSTKGDSWPVSNSWTRVHDQRFQYISSVLLNIIENIAIGTWNVRIFLRWPLPNLNDHRSHCEDGSVDIPESDRGKAEIRGSCI